MGLLRFVAVVLASLLSVGASRAVLVGTVARVVDGDTLVVQLASGPIRVRLYGIDAPEHNQAGGAEATTALASLVSGARVELEPISQDRYSRMVARVLRGPLDVNAEMVRRGEAWVYRHYLRREDNGWCAFEGEARRAHRGLWSLRDPVPPWDFRHHTAGPAVPACP
jgi:endonuclease YncB( thermonuclease family)